jgi:hypothetical protein
VLSYISHFVNRVFDYYTQEGLRGLIYAVGPKIVRSQAISAAEVPEKDATVWECGTEAEIKLSSPKNQRLHTQFNDYPSQFQSKKSRIFELTNCTLIGKNAAGVYNRISLISESTAGRLTPMYVGSRYTILRYAVSPTRRYRNTTQFEYVFPLISPDPSYYHWMVEFLPKVRLLKKYQMMTGRNPIILIESNPRDFIVESLEFFGVSSKHIHTWNSEFASVEKLIITTHRPHGFNYDRPSGSNYNPCIRDLQWLRTQAQSTLSEYECATDDEKRLYISRQSASRGRRVLNFDILTQILDEYGFGIHKLEEYSFDEQIRLCAGADIIMGPHGAGLLNTIFADDPTMIELFPESVIKPHFYFLSEMLDIEYRSCVTEAEGNNLVVDTDEMKEIISSSIDS